MIETNKKRHRTVEIADPDLGRAGVEIEGAFFINFSRRIGSGKDFDANGRSTREGGRCVSDEPVFLSGSQQDDIGDPDLTAASKDSLLHCGEFADVKLVEQISNSTSSLPMFESRGWRHDELAGSVDLKAFGQIGEDGIAADFKPPSDGGSVG
jgi:hypothetical protein